MIRRRYKIIFERWQKLWRRIEGTELEPPIWHSHFLSYHNAKRTLHHLGFRLHGRVIDIGSGSGHGSRYLNQHKTNYFPTDLPTGRGPNDHRISHVSIKPLVYCSVYELPFADGSFDGGLMLSVLEHLDCPERALIEVRRVIKPDGVILLSTPFAFPVHGEPHDYRRWTPIGITHELNNCGLKAVKVAACGGIFSSICINLHLAIRYNLPSHSRSATLLVTAVLPFLLIFQAITNLLALILDKMDRSGTFPLTVAVLARKVVTM